MPTDGDGLVAFRSAQRPPVGVSAVNEPETKAGEAALNWISAAFNHQRLTLGRVELLTIPAMERELLEHALTASVPPTTCGLAADRAVLSPL